LENLLNIKRILVTKEISCPRRFCLNFRPPGAPSNYSEYVLSRITPNDERNTRDENSRRVSPLSLDLLGRFINLNVATSSDGDD